MDESKLNEFYDEKLSKLGEDKFRKRLHRSIDKILLTHKNSRIFLLMMSGPFLVVLYLFKYALKLLIIYWLYKKKKVPGKKDSERAMKSKAALSKIEL